MATKTTILLLLISLTLTSCDKSRTTATDGLVRIAAASDLRFAFDEIEQLFNAAHPEFPLEIIYGSSGRFRAQIENGAPYHLYFSADIDFAQQLYDKGFTASKVIPYAIGRIVLWAQKEDATQLTLDDLRESRFRHIAIANPRHAPYGTRAVEALESTGLYSEIESRLVFGENIAHTLQMVESGAANIGIIALSLALNPEVKARGGYYLIDDSLHLPLEQGFIVTSYGKDSVGARAFADYIQSDEARGVMVRYGFIMPN